ncbi:Exopolysaccharide biosynthesis protein [Cohnella sp. OV330]|uniref:phosphodiester glycosidase family protein n=1 Tax=Cohnella sp. OV330 TaxID=1855288 RepID=UPI0008ED70D3|nr:phosphodiester glycosidase family protein [Cohnella sp. OV330]SFB61891.1 Exopolysaccharide biosynthesis protein [Cohnella sp. OV330]
MRTGVQQLNRTVLLACAPFLGMLIWLIAAGVKPEAPDIGPPVQTPGPSLAGYAEPQIESLVRAGAIAKDISASVKRVSELYTKTNMSMSAMMSTVKAQVGRPAAIYDRRISIKLGYPRDSVQSDKLTAQLYTIRAQYFSGYALKVKLKSDKAMSMALAGGKPGSSETTLAAVKRTGAIAGVNAGGFADQGGKRYPLSTTVVGGEYVTGFEPSFNDLFFVGLNEDLKLIGGKYSNKSQLDKEKPKFGASFVPVLRKNGVNLPIPAKWRTSPLRAPRTVIANYKDNQVLMIVIDGRGEDGSSGATLEELQILLSRFGTIDGYNLDGGGSSTLVFKGRVVNSPSDGQLRRLATNFLFFK